jgi:hypothetical protein
MRRAIFLFSVFIVPACFTLPKVDVIRVLDDFAEDGGLSAPTWGAFGAWSCEVLGQPGDGGQDAGLDGGSDAGQAASCTLGLGAGANAKLDPPPFDGAVPQALVAIFNIASPSKVEVTTPVKPVFSHGAADALSLSTTVDLTAFSELTFNTTLGPVIPPDTELHVELRCSHPSMDGSVINDLLDLLLDSSVGLKLGSGTFQPIAHPFSEFTLMSGASQRQTCLASVNSIGFVVVPNNVPAGTRIDAMLQLDNIRFQ